MVKHPGYALKPPGPFWPLLVIAALLAAIGATMLYSAAGGSLSPWAGQHIIRFCLASALLLAIAFIPLKIIWLTAYLNYALSLGLLVLVEVTGVTGMGAQRWINLYFFQIQPSELMKITLLIAIARYLHALTPLQLSQARACVVPIIMSALPVFLIARQPDLGTAMLLAFGTTIVLFCAGIPLRVFAGALAGLLLLIPIAWQWLLLDYQKQRILIFLNASTDALGSGYHIQQAKIALGAGGLFGRGFLQGTQANLNFLPEKHTDFIFTLLAEQFGFLGSLSVIALFLILTLCALMLTCRSRSVFARLIGLAGTVTIMLYAMINMAMVMGVIPVVGVPLPLISYGGTAMITVMSALGLVMNCWINRHVLTPA